MLSILSEITFSWHGISKGDAIRPNGPDFEEPAMPVRNKN
jgi:hypothetical protein